MSQPVLDIRDLSVSFISEGISNTAVEGVNIRVHKGEIVAIVGESGSGKSVSSLSVLQLLPTPPAKYTSGQILYTSPQGQTTDLLTCPRDYLRAVRGNEIAMIFQEPMTSLNPVYTCGNQVMEAIKLHKKVGSAEAWQLTLSLFEKVKLPDPAAMFNRFPHQVSGGQKQRVMIAMAMSCDPALLICDEPTTALDVTVQKTILDLIKELQVQQDMGVIFITHDLNVVAEIADRVVVMYKGRIVEQGDAQQIYHTPKHPYTRALLACRPLLHHKGERLPVVSDFMLVKPDGTIEEIPVADGPKTSLTEPHEPASVFTVENTAGKQPLLRVEHLKVWFPAKRSIFKRANTFTRAVDDVSFEVFEGETLGLVGESGCGKTTLGRSILNLVKPTAGEVFFRGKALNEMTAGEWKSIRKDLQIIFQDPYSSLNPRMTIGAAIAEPLKVHGEKLSGKRIKEKVVDLLEKVNLKPDFYDRYPHEFSGGQRQRIVIARALILNPAFIVCDESVSALDVSVQAQVLNLLNDLKKDLGFTAIFISHDLSVVRYISDRIMVMNKGKIVEAGNADDIYRNPQSPYTQKLIASIPKGIAEGL